MTGEEKFLSLLTKAVDDREKNTIVRRTDFKYLNGHGTFYRLREESIPNLLKAKEGERVSLVLYNMHTERLDEVVFDLIGQFQNGDCTVYWGCISDVDDYFAIDVNYYSTHEANSYALVYASGPPATEYLKKLCP